MRFQFSYKNMTSSDSLKHYTETKVKEKVEMYVTKAIEVHVTFEVNKRNHWLHCALEGGDGFNMQVEHTTEDMYKSVDGLVDKLEVQLKRHKEKVKQHKGNHNVRAIGKKPGHGRWESTKEESIDAGDIIKFEEARKRKSS